MKSLIYKALNRFNKDKGNFFSDELLADTEVTLVGIYYVLILIYLDTFVQTNPEKYRQEGDRFESAADYLTFLGTSSQSLAIILATCD